MAQQIGNKMPDGTIYAGLSPDTGKGMYTMPADASMVYTFKEAQKYASKLDAHGHQDWRVPTKAELNVLFNNSDTLGGFNVTGSRPSGWYWSSSQTNYNAWGQRFSDGLQYFIDKIDDSSLRCVR